MKSFIFAFALFLVASVNGAWELRLPKWIRESKWFKETDEAFEDWMIKYRMPERFIRKKLPPDWVPNENAHFRTPETQKIWEQM